MVIGLRADSTGLLLGSQGCVGRLASREGVADERGPSGRSAPAKLPGETLDAAQVRRVDRGEDAVDAEGGEPIVAGRAGCRADLVGDRAECGLVARGDVAVVSEMSGGRAVTTEPSPMSVPLVSMPFTARENCLSR